MLEQFVFLFFSLYWTVTCIMFLTWEMVLTSSKAIRTHLSTITTGIMSWSHATPTTSTQSRSTPRSPHKPRWGPRTWIWKVRVYSPVIIIAQFFCISCNILFWLECFQFVVSCSTFYTQPPEGSSNTVSEIQTLHFYRLSFYYSMSIWDPCPLLSRWPVCWRSV